MHAVHVMHFFASSSQTMHSVAKHVYVALPCSNNKELIEALAPCRQRAGRHSAAVADQKAKAGTELCARAEETVQGDSAGGAPMIDHGASVAACLQYRD